jgi:hypothetical protein
MKHLIVVFMIAALFVAGCSQDDPMEPNGSVTINDKDGTEFLGETTVANGSGFAEGGVGMTGVDEGILDIMVPAGSTVEQVLLYWVGGTTAALGDDEIEIDGTPVTGDLIGGPTVFYGNYSFSAYRADITAMDLVAPGANSFTISGMDFDFTGGPNDENDGVGMIVVYDDGSAGELQYFDGLDLAYFEFSPTLDATVPVTFDFAASTEARVAQLIVQSGSVGENRPNQVVATTSAGDQVFDNPMGSTDGNDFDSIVLDVDIPAGDTQLTVQLFSVPSTSPQGASLTWTGTGLTIPGEPPLYCIGDYVWFDENGDGCQDEGEMGAAGVEVNLWAGCPPVEIISTTMTDTDGMYEFCDLEPGDYTVQFVAPEGYEFCEQYASACGPEFDSNAGPDGITDCVTLVDADDRTIDAALCMPETYCIGDLVWYDEDRDGCQDEGEMGAEGVEVNLWIGCPPVEVIATTLTDANGEYLFCELEPGDYTVQFVAPGDYMFCQQYAEACGPEFDSNAGKDGITDCVTIVDQDDLTIDAGLCMPPEEGCTYTIGKWKNWTGLGNGNQSDIVTPLLPIWLGDADGAKSIPVTDVYIAVDVLSQHVYGHSSNAITKLYAQMLGAKLGVANGASDAAIADYLDDADEFLAMYDYTDWNSLSNEMKSDVRMWHGAFASYNEGDIGPGHCDDDDDDEEYLRLNLK